jgi:hypothetical protein
LDRYLGAEKFRVLLEAHGVLAEKSEIIPGRFLKICPILQAPLVNDFLCLKPVHRGFDFSPDLFAVVGV